MQALGDRAGHLLRLACVGVQQSGHVLLRVVSLEIGRPVGYHRVAHAVGLVEGVAGEGLYKLEHLIGKLLGEPLAECALDKLLPLLPHNLRVLLAHRLAHHVCLSQCVAGKCLGNQKHLVLVDYDAVCLFQNVFEHRVGIANVNPAVLGVYEGVDVLHWPRAIERYHGGHVSQGRRLQLLDVPPHPGALKLEHTGGLAG